MRCDEMRTCETWEACARSDARLVADIQMAWVGNVSIGGASVSVCAASVSVWMTSLLLRELGYDERLVQYWERRRLLFLISVLSFVGINSFDCMRRG